MNGQKVFECLSKMSEEERKACHFWWMVNKPLIDSFMSGFRYNYAEIDEEVWSKIENELTSEVLSKMQEEVEKELDDSFSGIWEAYVEALQRKLNNFIWEWAEEHGIEPQCEFFEEIISK